MIISLFVNFFIILEDIVIKHTTIKEINIDNQYLKLLCKDQSSAGPMKSCLSETKTILGFKECPFGLLVVSACNRFSF